MNEEEDSQAVPPPKKTAQAPKVSAEVAEVFSYLLLKSGKKFRLETWAKKIAARLKTYTAADLKRAVDGYCADSWWLERANLDDLFKDDSKIDRWRNAPIGGPNGRAQGHSVVRGNGGYQPQPGYRSIKYADAEGHLTAEQIEGNRQALIQLGIDPDADDDDELPDVP